MTAWTITALSRLESALSADATLAEYVDTVGIVDADRADELPDFTRHAISIIPDAMPEPSAAWTTHNLERFRVRLRLFAEVWDPTDMSATITAYDASGGVGASEVGLAKFAADVQHALRRNTLSGLVQSTAIEADGPGQFATVASRDRDRMIKETTLTWVGEYIAPMSR